MKSLAWMVGLACFAVASVSQCDEPSSEAAILKIFSEAKARKVLDKGAGEGPAWHPRLGLHFSGGGHINRWSADAGIKVYREDGGTNGLYFDARQRLLACEPVKRRVSRTSVFGNVEVLTDRYKRMRYNQPNDLCVDSKGRIYFTDPKYGPRENLELKDDDGKVVEGVYRIDKNRSVTRIITHEVDRPNGIAISADDRYLFVADNNNNDVGGARKLFRFNLQADGSVDLKSQKLLHDWGKSRGPDGMALDVKGRLYVAGGLNKAHPPAETNDKLGGVYVFTPEGKLLAFIHVPNDEVTNCSFGGSDLKSLYITAGGTLWTIRTQEKGFLAWSRR